MNKQLQNFFDEIFEETFENEEGEMYLLLSLLNYMVGNFQGKRVKNYGLGSFIKDKQKTMSPNGLSPKGWSFKKTYVYLYFIFKNLEIEAETNFRLEDIEKFLNVNKKGDSKRIRYETNNKILNEFINNGNSKIFFKEPVFLYLEDKFYEWIEIENNFNTEENIEKILELIDEKIENFVSGKLSKKYGIYSFKKQKELLLNKLSINQNIFGNMFKISEDNFLEEGNSNNFAYLHFFSFLFRENYINIIEIYSVDETPIFDDKGNYLCENEKYSLMIYLQDSFIELLKGWIGFKEVLLDKIFDKEIKNILIKKKRNGEVNAIEAKREFIGNENKFVEIRKKYPNSKINTENYRGKTQKYEVIERIKLENNKKQI